VLLVKHSMSGPDLLDAKRYLEAMDALHGVSSNIEMTPDRTVHSAVWSLAVVSVWPDLREATRQGSLTTRQEFIGGDMCDLGAVLWTLCWRHDVALGKVRWRQATLPSA